MKEFFTSKIISLIVIIPTIIVVICKVIDQFELLLKFWRLLGKIKHLKPLLFKIKFLFHQSLISNIHNRFIHNLRDSLFFYDINYKNQHDRLNIENTFKLAEEINFTFATFLAINPTEMHCTIKVLCNDNKDVYTIGRSSLGRVHNNRDIDQGEDSPHKIRSNTDFCSILGRSDKILNWFKYPILCFHCNDLEKYSNLFKCSRKKYQYKSVLVFPIRYKDNNSWKYLGFLTFDLPYKDGFTKELPVTFEFINNTNQKNYEYHKELTKSVIFQLGALFADGLVPLLYKFSKPKNGLNKLK